MSGRDKKIINNVLDVLSTSSSRINRATSLQEVEAQRREAKIAIDLATTHKRSNSMAVAIVVGLLLLVMVFVAFTSHITNISGTTTGISAVNSTNSGSGTVNANCFLYNNLYGYNDVNVRKSYSLSAEVVGLYPDQTPITINTNEASRVADGYSWIRITVIGTNKSGWVVASKIYCN